jgi:acyl-CoA dehydrogenase
MFAAGPLTRFGTEQQQREYLPRLASEDGCLGAIAFTEPQAGSDLQAIGATATRDGDTRIVSGEKCYITNGGVAEITVVFPCEARRGDHCVLAGRGRSGHLRGPKGGKARAARPYTGSLVLDDARVPVDRLLGEEGQGFAIAMDFFEASRPQVAASATGIARAAFEYATDYAREREAFGKPLVSKQGVSFKLADMAMEIEAARLLVWRACAAVDAGEDAGLLGSNAKAFAGDAAMRATTEAVQVLGGAGIMDDHPVEKWFRDAKVMQIVEGTSEIQRLVISTYLRR